MTHDDDRLTRKVCELENILKRILGTVHRPDPSGPTKIRIKPGCVRLFEDAIKDGLTILHINGYTPKQEADES